MAKNDSDDQSSQPDNTQQASKPSGNGKKIIFAVIGLLIIAAIALIALSASSSTTPVITQNKSSNSTATYLSSDQAQAILGSQIANYSAQDLFNPASLINASDLFGAIPQLYDNVSSGWITSAQGTDAAANASLIYIVLQTSSAQAMSKSIGMSLYNFTGPVTPTVVSPGSYNGLNYTYGAYINGTTSYQTVYGWKNNDVVVAVLQENSGYSSNQTQFVAIASNSTP